MSTMYRIGVALISVCLLLYINTSTYLPNVPVKPISQDSSSPFKNGTHNRKEMIENDAVGFTGAPPVATLDDSPCPSLSRTALILPAAREDLHGWKPVIADHMFVFSAYVDPNERSHLTIHVVGLTKRKLLNNRGYRNVSCQLWSKQRTLRNTTTHPLLTRITPALAYIVGAPDKRSVAFRIRCKFDQELPQANGQYTISVVDGAPCSQPLNQFAVDNTFNHSVSKMDTFRVCIGSPMRFNFSNYHRFVEFMEMNIILGVSRTTLYHLNSDPVMKPFFDYYIERNLLTVITWIPPQTIKRPQHEGQPGLNQDCILRHMWRSKYVAIMDIDESIIPREAHTYTWSDMLRSINCEDRSLVLARNVFFRIDSPDDARFAEDTNVAVKYKLFNLLKTSRTELFMERGRSKTILRPENIELGHTHHSVIRAELNETQCILDPSQGALHHYRNNSVPLMKSEYYHQVVQDVTCHKYATDLVERVMRVYDEVDSHTDRNTAT